MGWMIYEKESGRLCRFLEVSFLIRCVPLGVNGGFVYIWLRCGSDLMLRVFFSTKNLFRFVLGKYMTFRLEGLFY